MEGILAGAAEQAVVPLSPVQAVLAEIAVEQILALVAVQQVLMLAAVERVRVLAAEQGVVPLVAVEHVLRLIAVDRVLMRAAPDRVLLGAAEDEVVALVAVQVVPPASRADRVRPGPAVQSVVADPERDELGALVAGDEVVAGAAGHRHLAHHRGELDVVELQAGTVGHLPHVDDEGLRLVRAGGRDRAVDDDCAIYGPGDGSRHDGTHVESGAVRKLVQEGLGAGGELVIGGRAARLHRRDQGVQGIALRLGQRRTLRGQLCARRQGRGDDIAVVVGVLHDRRRCGGGPAVRERLSLGRRPA